MDGVDLGEFGDDRDRAGPALLGLGATPTHAAQVVGDLVRWIVLDVRGASRQMPHAGRDDDVVVEDLHDVTGGAGRASSGGYPEGQPNAGIQPGDTLVFAIKILDAASWASSTSCPT